MDCGVLDEKMNYIINGLNERENEEFLFSLRKYY